MSEKELFDAVVNYFVEHYHITIDYPYNDSYMSIKKDGLEIGGMNPSGYNLLRNLSEFLTILKEELI